MEEKRIDLSEWHYAILVLNSENTEEVVHMVLYHSYPSDSDIFSLQQELFHDLRLNINKLVFEICLSEYAIQLIDIEKN